MAKKRKPMNLNVTIHLVPASNYREGRRLTRNIPLYIHVTYANPRYKRRSKIILKANIILPDIEHWNFFEGKLNPTSPNYDQISLGIDQRLAFIRRILWKGFRGGYVTKEQIIKQFKTNFRDDSVQMTRQTMVKQFDLYMGWANKAKGWSDSNYNTHWAMRTHIKTNFGNNYNIASITTSRMHEFASYLRVEKSLAVASINSYLGCLRLFLDWCFDQAYLDNTKYRDFKHRFNKGTAPVVYLDQFEINAIRNLELTGTKDLIRDMFITSCFTGLRFSDITRLNALHLRDKGHIRITSIKTNAQCYIPIMDTVDDILSKYDIKPSTRKPIFDKPNTNSSISHTHYNETMTEIAKMAGIDGQVMKITYKHGKQVENFKDRTKAITSHVGRKTFVCTALLRGVPLNVILKATGHRNINSLTPYISATDLTVDKEFQKMNF